MSPLWGFKTFGCPVFYKHVAPLGLKAAMHLSPLLTFPLSRLLTHYGLLLGDVGPRSTRDGDCRSFASVHDKGTSPGDWDVSGITRSAD